MLENRVQQGTALSTASTVPLVDILNNTIRYARGHQVSHPHLVINHTRDWIPDIFPPITCTSEKSQLQSTTGACGELACPLPLEASERINLNPGPCPF